MKSKRIISAALAVALLIVFCAACGTTPTSSTTGTNGTSATSTSPTTTEKVFKSVRIGVAYDPNTLDPASLNLDSASAAGYIMYEALLRDVDGIVGPGIAETWETSADMKEWTFRLRESTFSDGTPVTAEDFKNAIIRALDPEAGFSNSQTLQKLVNGAEYFKGEAAAEDVGVQVIDANTLKLSYIEPKFNFEFTSYLYAPIKISLADSIGIEYGTAADKVLGNGAFIVKEWVTDSTVTLAKNEKYWDAQSILIDEITLVVGAAGSDTAVDMMLTDQVDVAYFTNINQVRTLEDADYTYESITSSYRSLNVNHKGSTDEMEPFMSNLNFRKALNLAIDRENLTMSVLTTDQPAFRLNAPSEMGVAIAFNDEYPYEAWPTKADPEKARAHLQAALTELGKTIDDVPPLVLLCFESQSSITILSAVQDMLRQVLGLRSEVSAQTISNMISMAFGGQYDLWLGGNSVSVPDWLVSFGFGYTSESYAATPLLRGYNNPVYDMLYNNVASSTDYTLRKNALFELEKYFCDNVINIILSWTSTYYVQSSDVRNVYFRANGSPYYAMIDID